MRDCRTRLSTRRKLECPKSRSQKNSQAKSQSSMKPRLDHIGIAVRSIEATRIYKDLGLDIDHVEVVVSQGVRTAFLSVGDSNLELLEPITENSPIGKFIEKRGEGLHHLCFQVDDLDEQLERLQKKGYRLINAQPVSGAHGRRIAFLHPSAANGLLIELSEGERKP